MNHGSRKDAPSTKASLQSLPRISDRLSFLYLERCIINRFENALTVTDIRGTVHVPSAMLSVLLLGPGSRITHRAMELIGDTGSSVIWVGESGVRYYAHGRPLTHSSSLVCAQAALVSNSRSRLAVARRMYGMRFPGEDISLLSMQQLRGREGARVRSVYRKLSHQTNVPWTGREYDPDDFEAGDAINQALSAAHACLYGVVHSVIVALGCSPALGFIHTGHERSFVYDIADLYKAEVTIPVAFSTVANNNEVEDIGSVTRLAVRDAISDGQLLVKATRDIRSLLSFNDDGIDDTAQILNLWDDKSGFVRSGVSYVEESEEQEPEEEGYGKVLDPEI